MTNNHLLDSQSVRLFHILKFPLNLSIICRPWMTSSIIWCKHKGLDWWFPIIFASHTLLIICYNVSPHLTRLSNSKRCILNNMRLKASKPYIIHDFSMLCLQCFDAAGWVAGRASSLLKLSGEVLVWLSVWHEVEIICIWTSWFHCHCSFICLDKPLYNCNLHNFFQWQITMKLILYYYAIATKNSNMRLKASKPYIIHNFSMLCLQHFDAVGWVAGRASSLLKLSGEVLVWLSVWHEVEIICIWTSWFHCHSSFICLDKPLYNCNMHNSSSEK